MNAVFTKKRYKYFMSIALVVLIAIVGLTIYFYKQSPKASIQPYLDTFYDMEEEAKDYFKAATDPNLTIEQRTHKIDKAIDSWVNITNFWYEVELKEEQNSNFSDIDLLILNKMIDYSRLRSRMCDCYYEILTTDLTRKSNYEDVNFSYNETIQEIERLLHKEIKPLIESLPTPEHGFFVGIKESLSTTSSK